MTLELPVLRLGLAGFDEAAQRRLSMQLSTAATGGVHWEISALPLADAYWVCGPSAQLLAGDILHVRSAAHPGRADIQLHLPGLERPIAFTAPATSTRRCLHRSRSML